MLLPLVCLWAAVRALLGWYGYRTDSTGIRLLALARKRLIPWDDIRTAEYRPAAGGRAAVLSMETSSGRMSLGLAGFVSAQYGDILAASVYQRLREDGRMAKPQLGAHALRMWMDVPREVPEDVDWSGKAPLADLLVPVATLWISLLLMVALISLPVPIAIGLALPGTYLLAQSPALGTAASARVTRDGLTARTLAGTVTLRWNEAGAAWMTPDILRIQGTNKRPMVNLPFKLGDQASEELVLAAIRRLRDTAGLAIEVPLTTISDPDLWEAPCRTSDVRGRLQIAFLRGLPTPVGRRLNLARNTQAAGVAAGITLGMVAAFSGVVPLFSRWLHTTADAQLVVTPAEALMILPVIFGLTAAICYGAQMLTRCITGRCVEEWRRMLAIGGPVKPVRWLLPALAIAGALPVAASVLFFVRFEPDAIVVQSPWRSAHRLEQINRISIVTRTASDGRPCPTRTYAIEFSDGDQLGFSEARPERHKEVERALREVSLRSGKPVERIEL